MKKIWKAAKTKSCEDLVKWLASISKMIYWSLGTSKGRYNHQSLFLWICNNCLLFKGTAN